VPSVFISYSHDPADPAHAESVAGLAASLRRDGLKVFFDQYRGDDEEKVPWPIWMEGKIEEADRVLLVCTELYLKKVRQRVSEDERQGVCWEANIIYALLYERRLNPTKFLPVLFSPADRRFIPTLLKGRDCFMVDSQSGYNHLYALLTNQHRIHFPERGAALQTAQKTTEEPKMERVKVFISYSHKDEIWKDHLLTHLSVLDYEGLLHVWTDRRIEVGAAWQAQINKAMSDSRVAVLLVTANFLTSEFIRNQEVPRLLELHAQSGMLVLPLLARPCPWKLVSWLAPRQVRPKDGRPLSAGNEVDVDADLTALTYEISSLINRIDARTAAEQLTVSDRILEHQSRLPGGSSLGSAPKSEITSLHLANRELETAFQTVQVPMSYIATKQHVAASGVPPNDFLDQLVAWGKQSSDEIFAYNAFSDIYSSVINTLGPWQGIAHRRAVMLEVMRVLAGFESSWNFGKGEDATTYITPATPNDIRAGAWQVNANALNFGEELVNLVLANVGTVDGNDFQRVMKENHPLAMEFVARLLRRTTQYHGPVLYHQIDPWLRRDAVTEFQALM
jgi:hypothetical protein